jgi:hypothetical protein
LGFFWDLFFRVRMYCLPGKHYRDSAAVSLYLPARQHSTQRNQQRTNSQRAIYFSGMAHSPEMVRVME